MGQFAPVITDWKKLREALATGSEQYIAERSSGTLQEGFYHGKKGLRRAQYISSRLQTACDDLETLALVYAIFSPNPTWFESRSTALALCIAKKLIRGSYIRTITLDTVEEDVNTLSSEAFDVKRVRDENDGSYETAGTDTFATTFVNKIEKVRSILRGTRNAMPEEYKSIFDSRVNFFKTEATKEHTVLARSAHNPETPEPDDLELTSAVLGKKSG